MSIVVMGATFVDIKGFPLDAYIPTGRNVGYIEYVHGGVSRNVVEDIANLELRPTFLGIVDETPLGVDVIKKLKDHKVNTDYVLVRPNGMGTWLAVFDNSGDVAGSISKRPNMLPLVDLLQNVQIEGKFDDAGGKKGFLRPVSEGKSGDEIFVVKAHMAGQAIRFPGDALQDIQFFFHKIHSFFPMIAENPGGNKSRRGNLIRYRAAGSSRPRPAGR